MSAAAVAWVRLKSEGFLMGFRDSVTAFMAIPMKKPSLGGLFGFKKFDSDCDGFL